MTHPLLARQLKRLGLREEAAEPVWRELLARVARAYADADGERYVLERSLSISSREMRELNDRLRDEAGERLAEERDRLRAVIGSLGAGLAVLDPAGRVASANPEAARLLGWEASEAAGRPFFEAVGLAGAGGLDEPSRDEDGCFRRADGSDFPVAYALNPVMEGGRFAGAVVVFQDITTRKRHERALLESEARHRELLAAAERQAGELALLDRVRTALAREVEPGAVIRAVVEGIAETFGYPQVSLYLLENGALALQHQVGYAEVIARLPPERGVMGRVARTGVPALLENAAAVAADPDFVGAFAGISAEVCVPLLERGTVVGVLNVETSEGALTEADLRLMTALAEHVGVALERARLMAALAHQAGHDALTGLPNRVTFEARLRGALERSARSGTAVAVFFVDLDGFKLVNDTLGHAAGDALLRAVAGRLGKVVRPGDTLARMGGDEFTLVAEGLERPEDAEELAGRLLETLRAPLVVDGHELFVSASVGLSLAPRDGHDAATLARHADSAMYQAKSGGKNGYRRFAPPMNAVASERWRLENDLRRAVHRGELSLHYQPLVDLALGRPTGFEALLRWRHPSLGPIPPAKFVPVAEESGLIVELGAWVLEEACRQARGWRGGGTAPRVAVNVSPLQFGRADLADGVAGVLARFGLDPSRLELELTEGAVMSNAEESARQLGRLRALGVGVLIDDFGTGHSSLALLPRLPISGLKIDRSFVAGLETEGSGFRPLVEAVLAMARGLGLSVTAEGVERPAQLELLRRLGCDRAQGYLLGRPRPFEDIEAELGAGLVRT